MTEHDALLEAVKQDPGVGPIFADWLQEHDRPEHVHLFRALSGSPAHPRFGHSRPHIRGFLPYTADRVYRYLGEYNNRFPERNAICFIHSPDAGPDSPYFQAHVQSKQHARHLIQDLPEETRKSIEASFIPHLPDALDPLYSAALNRPKDEAALTALVKGLQAEGITRGPVERGNAAWVQHPTRRAVAASLTAGRPFGVPGASNHEDYLNTVLHYVREGMHTEAAQVHKRLAEQHAAQARYAFARRSRAPVDLVYAANCLASRRAARAHALAARWHEYHQGDAMPPVRLAAADEGVAAMRAYTAAQKKKKNAAQTDAVQSLKRLYHAHEEGRLSHPEAQKHLKAAVVAYRAGNLSVVPSHADQALRRVSGPGRQPAENLQGTHRTEEERAKANAIAADQAAAIEERLKKAAEVDRLMAERDRLRTIISGKEPSNEEKIRNRNEELTREGYSPTGQGPVQHALEATPTAARPRKPAEAPTTLPKPPVSGRPPAQPIRPPTPVRQANYYHGAIGDKHGTVEGRYPINNATDLKNAERAIGRTPPDKRPAVRRHITERAHDLGLAAPTRESTKSDWISAKIRKIMHEGIRGKKVSQKQAAAVAYHMYGEK